MELCPFYRRTWRNDVIYLGWYFSAKVVFPVNQDNGENCHMHTLFRDHIQSFCHLSPAFLSKCHYASWGRCHHLMYCDRVFLILVSWLQSPSVFTQFCEWFLKFLWTWLNPFTAHKPSEVPTVCKFKSSYFLAPASFPKASCTRPHAWAVWYPWCPSLLPLGSSPFTGSSMSPSVEPSGAYSPPPPCWPVYPSTFVSSHSCSTGPRQTGDP